MLGESIVPTPLVVDSFVCTAVFEFGRQTLTVVIVSPSILFSAEVFVAGTKMGV